ncbi:MAG: antibiotic biosynthesis monooxygenase [Acidimicrobiales bacterium]|nr:antibiotic biosynthesis monooxygenase [Acidimicrobiales bacterium]MDG1845737.1 antibiotic biosynthesis monooxygenase [Acidimicrobiales bacterium]
MTHTMYIEFNCNDGKGNEFLQVLLPALEDTRSFDGCERVETFVNIDETDRVFLWEKWRDRSSQEAYLQWRMETGFLDLIGPYMSSLPSIAHLEPQD